MRLLSHTSLNLHGPPVEAQLVHNVDALRTHFSVRMVLKASAARSQVIGTASSKREPDKLVPLQA